MKNNNGELKAVMVHSNQGREFNEGTSGYKQKHVWQKAKWIFSTTDSFFYKGAFYFGFSSKLAEQIRKILGYLQYYITKINGVHIPENWHLITTQLYFKLYLFCYRSL